MVTAPPTDEDKAADRAEDKAADKAEAQFPVEAIIPTEVDTVMDIMTLAVTGKTKYHGRKIAFFVERLITGNQTARTE